MLTFHLGGHFTIELSIHDNLGVGNSFELLLKMPRNNISQKDLISDPTGLQGQSQGGIGGVYALRL